MRAAITGAGAWAPGVTRVSELAAPAQTEDKVAIPRPSAIPPRELRRSPAASRLGVEVASQACAAAAQDPARIRSVFASALGDSDITDYMCRTLAGADKLLSPTRFHNSVHNAAAGCWSIACENTSANTFVAAFAQTAGMALFESMIMVASDQNPTLLVVTDVPVPGALADIHGPGTTAAFALVIESPRDSAPTLSCELEPMLASQDDDTTDASHQHTPVQAHSDPAQATAALWPLVEALTKATSWSGEFQLGSQSRLVARLSEAN